MKKIIHLNNAAISADLGLLVARIGIAALMLTHGIPKLIMLFSGNPIQFPSVFGLSPEISLGLTVFAEVLCSVLLLLGFLTRFASIPLIITMLVAVFIMHGADPFASKEPALQYLVVYLVILFAGPGKYSVDHLLQRKPVTKFSKEVVDPTLAIFQ